jgi:predicted helicase
LKDARIAKGLDAEAVFKTFSPGVKTNRDAVVYDFNPDTLAGRVRQFVEDYNAEVDRYHRAGGKDNIDDFVHYDRVKWSEGLKANLARGRYAEFDESLACAALYRPFAQRELYFDDLLVERRYQLPQVFPRRKAEGKNIVVLSQSE